ncbi:MAG: helix-turn-helix transcriptional regulator [Eubacteriales bacterium]|nr:helix-turn-helix transcriptional regulator [Eubacteriales bacterium]
MGKNFRETWNERMKDPEFKKEWDALEPEYQIIRVMLNSRAEKSLTQQQLSKITGIPQADISRLENGNANPSLRTLQRLAEGMGMKLKLEFVPVNR